MKIILSTGILLATLLNLFSQENSIKFKHLTVQDGLSRNWVKAIYQDSIGYLWVGTEDGLNRYDGITFKTYRYRSGDPHSINNNNINLIHEDRKGRIWVGTQSGLNLYHREMDRFSPLTAVDNYISCIYEYNNGIFLIGSPGGLYLFDPSTLTAEQIRYDIQIEDILKDNNGNMWLATFSGVMLLDTIDYSYKVVKPLDTLNDDPYSLIRSLFQDSKGGIWAGTDSEGLIYFTYDKKKPEDAQFISFKSDPSDSYTISKGAIYSISEDPNGLLWIATENGGLSILNLNTFNGSDATFKRYVFNPVNPNGINDNSIHSIYRDRQNTMWVGTHGGGINYYNALVQQFNHFLHQPGTNTTINNNRVKAILEEDDYLWFGTEVGLNVLDKKSNTFKYYTYDYTNPHSIGSNAALTILRDSRNNLWVGTWGGGLNQFNEQTQSFKRFHYDEKDTSTIGSNNIVRIIESRDGSIWLATMRGGLNRYDYKTNSFERYLVDFDENSISNNWVFDVLESSSGDLWISTSIAVDLYNRETNHFTTFTHDPSNPKSISYNGAITFFEDSKGNIWLGTSNGLNVFNPTDSSFAHYFKSDGLPDNSIQAIVEDGSGNLWLSTNNGISKFIDGTDIPSKPVFINYNVNDGLQGNEFNARAVYRNRDGIIYFGGNNGYNTFDPNRIESNPHIPSIVFTRFLIFNRPITVGTQDSPLEKDISVSNRIKLKRKHSVFTIEFAALNLLAPKNNKYAYILEGFERDWNYIGNQHTATYTNLNPGKYTFKVIASNNNGLWNEEGISLEVVILPAWWQSWIAMSIYVIIIILVFYYFRENTIISVNLKNELWREHLEKQKTEELNQLKNQFYTNISHELRTPLTLMIGPLKQLLTNESLTGKLDTIYRNTTRLKELVDQILDFSKVENQMMRVNPTESDLVSFTRSILLNFSDYAAHKNISLTFESNVSFCKALLDEDKLEKIITNLISNAIKNTPSSGRVSTIIDADRAISHLKIEINDTGCGIKQEEIDHIFERFYTPANAQMAKQGTGIGLNLTRKLINLLEGSLRVSSQPNEGSTFTVDLPLTVIDDIHEEINEVYSYSKNDIDTSPKRRFDTESFEHEYTILIIDDNIDICLFIESILRSEYNVIWENDPTEAMNHISNYLPDLIISDVMMPQMDGFELSQRIKNDLRFSHIPLILLTAKVGVESQVAGYDTGADDYILKPFEEDVLKARVRNLIQRIEKLRKHFIGSDGIINPKAQANSLDIKFMEEVLDSIKKQYTNPDFDVNFIIDRMGMSRSVFYKKIKTLSDHSVNDLVKNYRLSKALDLLSSEQPSVSQVAYDCGFNDPAYFSKVFKEYYKVSPKEYISSTKG